MEVTITFRTPSHEGLQRGPTIHERTLVSVPRLQAEQMAEDFVQYRNGTNEEKEGELYRYQKDGEEVLVALDFREVVALTATGDT